MKTFLPTPSKEQIALLEPFERLGLHSIALVCTPQQADQALLELAGLTGSEALGFDTESKPTFVKDQLSDGPHIVQFSTLHKAYVFQLHDSACRSMVATFLASHAGPKVGFGLGDDRKRITAKLGVDARNVLDLNDVFRKRGYHKDMGVKTAVAMLFNQRFLKSKKATTSNWANAQLSDGQIIYAANDAYAALRVFNALGLHHPAAPVAP